jgi:hypothetical protein
MTLLNTPILRETIGGWLVAVRLISGTELLWGPYPERRDADAQAKRLRKHPELLTPPAQRERAQPQPSAGLFEEGETGG